MNANLIHIDGDPIEEQDLLFNAWAEGELTDAELADFEARLASDADFAADFEIFQTMMEGLDALPFEYAPDDFLDNVQDRISSRSAGRFFGDHPPTERMFYEVAAVAMMVIMASTYLIFGAPNDAHVGDVVVQADAPVLSPSKAPN